MTGKQITAIFSPQINLENSLAPFHEIIVEDDDETNFRAASLELGLPKVHEPEK